MQKSYSPEEYLYASARIRALEAHFCAKDQLNSLLDGGNAADAIAALFEAAGVAPSSDCREGSTEERLMAALRGGMATVAASVPDQGIVPLVALPYDCHNAKAYLKCKYLGVDPLPLTIDAGTLPVADLLAALKDTGTAPLPPHLKGALAEAEEAFAKTGDPREIDFLLDRALFADLASIAAELPFATELYRVKTDLANALICLRLCRRGGDTAAALLSKSFLPGGALGEGFFASLIEQGEEALVKALVTQTPYASVFENAVGESLADLEKRADDEIITRLLGAKKLPFGGEVPLAYLLALDSTVKNLRIVLSGRESGLDRAALCTKVRESYV